IRNPYLHLCAIERAGDELLVEWMLVVIALPANRVESRDEGAGTRDELSELRAWVRGPAT
ncbi:MAG TPA: hypothetical protein VKE42_05610, partial [Candidatus Cybelea sp.]|nr:hypothetical protein [Candidatus Cybelea sp.]